MQFPLFEVPSEWQPPRMSDLPSWAGAKRVGIDIETRDPHLKQLGPSVRRGGYIAGVSFAIEDGPAHYLPMRHQGGDNMESPEAVLAYLREQLQHPGIDLVGANLQYDLDYMMEAGLDFSKTRAFRDVQVADPLIYELHPRYSLQHIAERHGLPGKDEELLRKAAREYKIDPKSEMWKLPARFVGAYAEADARQPLMILRRQERLIEEADLWKVWNLESEVLPVLVRMRRRGVRIDFDQLDHVESWALTQEQEALEKIHHTTGHRIEVGNVWKADALAPALEAIGVVLTKTPKGQPNIDKALLGGLDHPVATAMGWARKVNKLRTTFAASIRTHVVGDRIHCTFNQIARETESGDQKGARYGRLSSTDPNLQQQPARDQFAKMWRSIYLPDEGKLWCSNDYSQQEPRWTTHFSALLNLPKAREAAQAYHDDPNLDNHQFMSDLTGLERKQAKNIYLGLCYGEGGAKLCRELGLPTRWACASGKGRGRTMDFFDDKKQAMGHRRELGDGFVFETAGEEGQEILDRFDQRAPFIRQLAREATSTANKRGHIITVGGRHLHFPQKDNGQYDWTHKALNRLIQGSSGDQTKKAMIEVERAGYEIQLQVHDELANSVDNRAQGEAIGQIMRDVIPADVPFKVDTEIGKSWGDSME